MNFSLQHMARIVETEQAQGGVGECNSRSLGPEHKMQIKLKGSLSEQLIVFDIKYQRFCGSFNNLSYYPLPLGKRVGNGSFRITEIQITENLQYIYFRGKLTVIYHFFCRVQ